MRDLAKRNDIPDVVAEQYEELVAFSTDRLKDELVQSLHLSAAHLRRLAVIVRLLEERGEDLSELKLEILPHLRLIAYGQLLPEALVKYGHSPGFLRIVKTLPLPDQKRLADGESVPLVVRRDNGEFDHRLADPALLSRDQMSQVFSLGRIRAIPEQILILEARGKPKPPREPEPVGRVRPDKVRGGLWVGRTFVPTADVMAALAFLAGPASDEEENTTGRQVGVYVTEAQYERLRKAAFDGRVPMATLLRRAALAMGVI